MWKCADCSLSTIHDELQLIDPDAENIRLPIDLLPRRDVCDVSVTASPVFTPHQHVINISVYTPSQVPSSVVRTIRDPATPRLLPVVDDPGAIMEKPPSSPLLIPQIKKTFNITGVFDVPAEIIDRSIQDLDPAMTMVVTRETTYTFLEGAMQRKLVDTLGFDSLLSDIGLSEW